MIPSFDVTAEESALIARIVTRAEAMAREHGVPFSRMDTHMDLTACHANGMPLDLAALLSAPAADFGHDVFGISRHIDRRTGKIGDCFVPRTARPS